MPRVLVPLARGFEEIEAVTLIDVLRGDVEVVVAALEEPGAIDGAHGIAVQAPLGLASVLDQSFDLILLPGGEPGTTHLASDPRLAKLLQRQGSEGRPVAAICAAPRAGCKPGDYCLAAHTLIETPDGPVPVEDLSVGDPVWTMNAAGERVPSTVLATSADPATPNQPILHILLADGRRLWGSPRHPTADGRLLQDLRPGDSLDHSTVLLSERLEYGEAATYDLLPAGPMGYYWANGILLGSTLRKP